MKPNVIVRIEKFDFTKNTEENFGCVYFLILMVLAVRAVPFHAEKYNTILDFTNVRLAGIPYRALY